MTVYEARRRRTARHRAPTTSTWRNITNLFKVWLAR